MVYTSLPVYLDPPNWNQQQHQHQQSHQAGGSGGGGTGGIITGGGGVNTSDLQQSLAPLRPEGGGVVGTAARPGSMADRARLAKLPQPEPALKCPRCDSTNTKFCYYNNYSLSQPRHFCKTCRRYWTRGGALRNVPVGGGCRRNKRSKSATSKTLANEGKGPGTASAMGAALAAAAASGGVGGTIGSSLSALPQLPFLSSLHPFPDYRSASAGLNYGGIQTMDHVEYEVGSSSGSGLEQWRLQQVQEFPFFTGLETAQPSISLYPFNGTEGGGIDATATMFTGQLQGKPTCAGLINQLASVKMEENGHGLILPRQYLGIPANDQYWSSAGGGGSGATTAAARTGGGDSSTSGGATWTDLSGFHSSSTGNLL